ncbi:unnamed protein product [Discula destructiva]
MDVPLAEDREFAMLDAGQISTLNALERMGATLSLFGIVMIFITFALFKRLRSIPNTFIFFASIANVGACIACLIAYDGITSLHKDPDSPLCQAQGFMLEWFMQSDPWWSFAMAINVYMVFFMSFNPATFRHYLWLYCLVCYGLPAIPAFVFLFIDLEKGPIYGDAVLWCWIGSQWNSLRIYSYYLPIWVCSVLSAVIYFAVGYHVFHQRNQLRNLSLSTQGKDLSADSTDVRATPEKMLISKTGPQYYGSVTTEIKVTSAAMPTSPLPAYTNPFEVSPKTPYTSPVRRPSEAPSALRINTSDAAAHTTTGGNAPGVLSSMHTHNYPWSREPSSFPAANGSPAAPLVGHTAGNAFASPFGAAPPRATRFETLNHSFNATQYTSITAGTGPEQDDRGPSPTRLLTAISKRTPTSESELARTHSSRGGSDETETNGSGANKQQQQQQQQEQQQQQQPHQQHSRPQPNIFRRMSEGTRRFGARLKHMDPVKLAYLRTSFVFAISILVTWTPSSINRVYTLIYPNDASFGLNIAAAVVLPLQGVWNAVIYFTTSWKIFREEMEATTGGSRLFRLLGLHSRPAESGGGGTRRRQSGSFALVSSVRTPRSEMGKSRRLEGESVDGDGVAGVELQSPMSSPRQSPHMARVSTMRVTQKQLDDFA